MATFVHRPTAGNRRSSAAPAASLQSAAGENVLLAALPIPVFAVLQKHIYTRTFSEGTVLWEADGAIDHIYFPRSGMISIRVPTGNGHGIEVATLGREAAAGCCPEGGAAGTRTRAVTQVAGQFACIARERFLQLAREHEELAALSRCCNDWLLLQAQQIAACNSVHAATARFCRWLLRAGDALGDDTIRVTQEAIAEALGVRRTTATLIAQRLQSNGAISYRRGKIAIRDRTGLEAAACDCQIALRWRNWPAELMRVHAGAPRDCRHSAASATARSKRLIPLPMTSASFSNSGRRPAQD